jgi:hypothetical protein
VSAGLPTVTGRFETYHVADEPLAMPPIGRAKLFEVSGRPDLLYKRFGRPRQGQEEIARLESLAFAGRRRFKEGDPPNKTHYIAWPRDFVATEEGLIEGVVIPRAEPRFFLPRQTMFLTPRSFSYLKRSEPEVPARARLTLVRQLAQAFAFLHERELVHGDISNNNVLWCPPPRPSVLLIDCDGLRDLAFPGGGGTPDWLDPREVNGEITQPDMQTDWYALALAIWRKSTLLRGTPIDKNGSFLLPPGYPLRLGELMRRVFEDDRDAAARPTPAEWVDALGIVLGRSAQCRELDAIAYPQGSESFRSPPEERTPSSTPAPSPTPLTPLPGSARAPQKPAPARPRVRPRRRFSRLLGLPAAVIILAVAIILGGSWIHGPHRPSAQTRPSTPWRSAPAPSWDPESMHPVRPAARYMPVPVTRARWSPTAAPSAWCESP